MFLVLTLLCLSCNNLPEQESSPPNILFILSDDHTSQSWGIYNSILDEYIQNENIKRLAEEGTVLDNVFCTNSICVPSRGSILTGQYSHQNGIYTLSDALEPQQETIAKELQKSGYETAVIGKWHLKKEPTGFDYYLVLPGQGVYDNPKLKSQVNWQDGGKGGKEYKGFSSDVIGDETIKWLEQRDESKPFFLNMHFKATHEPFDYPARYDTMYEDVEFPEPHSLFDFKPETNGRTFKGQKLDVLEERWMTHTKNNNHGRYPGLPFSTEGLSDTLARQKTYQKFVKDFLRSGAAIDDNIGKVLDYLDQHGMDDNTIVIYTADQGYFLGEHGMMDKRMFYEESLRMPFVIRYPEEIPSGTRLDDMILNIDFAALFADYAGISKPSFVQGHSFRQNLKGQTPLDWREDMYYRYWLHQTQRPAHFGIRDERYKLIFYYGHPLTMTGAMKEATEPAWEFYDLRTDPHEDNNAYSEQKYQDVITEMKLRLIAMRKDLKDDDKGNETMGIIFEKHFAEAL